MENSNDDRASIVEQAIKSEPSQRDDDTRDEQQPDAQRPEASV
jgi:hypothetical protein